MVPENSKLHGLIHRYFYNEYSPPTETSGHTIDQVAEDLWLCLSILTSRKRQYREADLLAGPHVRCYPSLDRPEQELPGVMSRAAEADDEPFMSDIGGLLPMALCGRRSASSCEESIALRSLRLLGTQSSHCLNPNHGC